VMTATFVSVIIGKSRCSLLSTNPTVPQKAIYTTIIVVPGIHEVRRVAGRYLNEYQHCGIYCLLRNRRVRDRIYGSKIVIGLEQCMLISTWGVKTCMLMLYWRGIHEVRRVAGRYLNEYQHCGIYCLLRNRRVSRKITMLASFD
jgi:hypothetical protein